MSKIDYSVQSPKSYTMDMLRFFLKIIYPVMILLFVLSVLVFPVNASTTVDYEISNGTYDPMAFLTYIYYNGTNETNFHYIEWHGHAKDQGAKPGDTCGVSLWSQTATWTDYKLLDTGTIIYNSEWLDVWNSNVSLIVSLTGDWNNTNKSVTNKYQYHLKFDADCNVSYMASYRTFIYISTVITERVWFTGDGTYGSQRIANGTYRIKYGEILETVPIMGVSCDNLTGESPLWTHCDANYNGTDYPPTMYNFTLTYPNGVGHEPLETGSDYTFQSLMMPGLYDLKIRGCNAIGCNETTRLDYIKVEYAPFCDFEYYYYNKSLYGCMAIGVIDRSLNEPDESWFAFGDSPNCTGGYTCGNMKGSLLHGLQGGFTYQTSGIYNIVHNTTNELGSCEISRSVNVLPCVIFTTAIPTVTQTEIPTMTVLPTITPFEINENLTFPNVTFPNITIPLSLNVMPVDWNVINVTAYIKASIPLSEYYLNLVYIALIVTNSVITYVISLAVMPLHFVSYNVAFSLAAMQELFTGYLTGAYPILLAMQYFTMALPVKVVNLVTLVFTFDVFRQVYQMLEPKVQ